ncbi:MAG TPA: hypothetical protein VFE98_02810 [Candidatus Bathyarchaeia archaeon]|nr:hypothetical protein [Candidatus Bathyarchaeia archaeon]
MATRATIAFVLSIIGATYQIMSFGLAALVDLRASSLYLYYGGFTDTFLLTLVTFWAASHLLEDWKGRATWPAIILALGIANVSNLVIAYFLPYNVLGTPLGTNPSLAQFLVIIPGSILALVGGLVGFAAVRQYSREHGHVIVHQP